MWRWIYCYLSGSHEYSVACEPGEIFLRCRTCGRRSSGWELREEHARMAPPALRRVEVTASPAKHAA